jgi:fatty-acyl-CoA synthase
VRPNLVIGEIFGNASKAVPDKVAAVLGSRTMTFAELEAASNSMARLLRSLGISTGARVATWCSTTMDSVTLFAALAKLGAVFIPFNGLLGAPEVRAVIESAKPDLLLVDEAHLGPARQLPNDVTGFETVLEDSKGYANVPVSAEAQLISGSDPHVVFFTSGSTGAPKGAVITHETSYLRSHPGALLEPRGPMVCPYPLFHMGAWTIALQQWQARDSVVLLESADAEAVLEAVARNRATRINCVPAVWRRVLAALEGTEKRSELASLRFADTGTSQTPLDLLEAIEQALPLVHIRVFYGSTEAGIVTSLDHADMRRKPGSCGVPAPGVMVRTDEAGELWVNSKTLFEGYLDQPKATAAALDDGWYRTGDVVEIDEDGFLTIVGRVGELIRTGGESVAPSEVESVLAELQSVSEVAVVGLPDSDWGEVVCAVVVSSDSGDGPTLDELRAHCQGRLAPYKHPRRMEVVSSLPRTPATGQVQRRVLVERLTHS